MDSSQFSCFHTTDYENQGCKDDVNDKKLYPVYWVWPTARRQSRPPDKLSGKIKKILDRHKYTGCTLKLRAVKLLFVIFGRLTYTFFVKIMDRLLARGGSNDISKDVFSISVIKNWIYNKGKLIFAKITAQNSKIKERESPLRTPIFLKNGQINRVTKFSSTFRPTESDSQKKIGWLPGF